MGWVNILNWWVASDKYFPHCPSKAQTLPSSPHYYPDSNLILPGQKTFPADVPRYWDIQTKHFPAQRPSCHPIYSPGSLTWRRDHRQDTPRRQLLRQRLLQLGWEAFLTESSGTFFWGYFICMTLFTPKIKQNNMRLILRWDLPLGLCLSEWRHKTCQSTEFRLLQNGRIRIKPQAASSYP